MNKLLKKRTSFIIIILLISCRTNKVIINNTEVNTFPNSEYEKSIKAFSGAWNKSEYNELIKRLELELKTKIPTDKSVIINYNQKAPNCITVRFSEKDKKQVVNNGIRNSSRISSNNNAIDFFVYTGDSYDKDIYEKMPEFILDSGFFYKNIFTEHQNCEGFLIIKPNGEFLKYYGEDYYDHVKTFLKRK